MGDATVIIDSKGQLALQGQLSFASVPGLWKTCRQHLESTDLDTVDLAQVTQSDSAGLALLTACLRHVKNKNRTLTFLNMPEQMREIARVSSLDNVLNLAQ